MDTEMNRLHLHVDTPCSKSAKKSVFGSIERSMDKLLCMLTPKKKPYSPDKPRTVKVYQHTLCSQNFLLRSKEQAILLFLYPHLCTLTHWTPSACVSSTYYLCFLRTWLLLMLEGWMGSILCDKHSLFAEPSVYSPDFKTCLHSPNVAIVKHDQ